MRVTTTKERGKQFSKLLVHNLKGRKQAFPPFPVEAIDRLPKPRDRLFKINTLRCQVIHLLGDFGEFFISASEDGVVSAWDSDGMDAVSTRGLPRVTGLEPLPGGDEVVLCGERAFLAKWHPRTNELTPLKDSGSEEAWRDIAILAGGLHLS